MNANEYFMKQTEKVYIEKNYKIETFAEYLGHRYRDNCYYYSSYALMGLNPDDFLVRGFIKVESDISFITFISKTKNYHHGWVEFTFENNEYIFDSLLKEVVPKADWYEKFQPEITYKKSQKEILDKFLNEKYAIEIKKGFWQFDDLILEDEQTLDNIYDYDRINGYIPSSLILARLQTYDSKVTRFIAYSQPSC